MSILLILINHNVRPLAGLGLKKMALFYCGLRHPNSILSRQTYFFIEVDLEIL
jgi:hypothetical protein